MTSKCSVTVKAVAEAVLAGVASAVEQVRVATVIMVYLLCRICRFCGCRLIKRINSFMTCVSMQEQRKYSTETTLWRSAGLCVTGPHVECNQDSIYKCLLASA